MFHKNQLGGITPIGSVWLVYLPKSCHQKSTIGKYTKIFNIHGSVMRHRMEILAWYFIFNSPLGIGILGVRAGFSTDQPVNRSRCSTVFVSVCVFCLTGFLKFAFSGSMSRSWR